MMLHNVALEFVHEFAVHVNDRAAAGAFEVEMPVAATRAVDELIHGSLAAVGNEFLDFSVLHHFVKTAVNRRLADFFAFGHKIHINIVGCHTDLRIEPEIVLDGLLLTCAVILSAFAVFHANTFNHNNIKVKMKIIFKLALLL